MQQTVSMRLRIIPDSCQAELLKRTMKVYSEACNYVSDYIFRTHDLTQSGLQKALYYSIRESFSLPAQMAQSVMRTAISAFKTILTNEKKWIMPDFRHLQLDLVRNRDWSFTKDMTVLSLNTLEGRIKVSFYRQGYEKYFSDGYRFGTAKPVYKRGKFYVHIPVTYEIDELSMPDVVNVVGIDRGIRFLAVSYDDNGKTVFYDGSQVKVKRAHFKDTRKSLQEKGTPSARKKLREIGQRENRYVNDVNHCIAKALVTSNPEGTLFVLEDLSGIRGATERVRKGNRYLTVSWPCHDLEQKLIYKAAANHQRVVKVDPAYTSQTCPECGHTEKANRDKRNHIFRCTCCGYTSNDDRIGAMNLHRMGRELTVPGADARE